MHVLQVQRLSKQYRIGEISTGTLAHDLNRWWHKFRGKPDPYLPVTQPNIRERGNDSVSSKETIDGTSPQLSAFLPHPSPSDYIWALRDINFEVKQGEVLGIIGRNGAGKSTLLKILSRVTAPTTGEVRIKGRIASLLEVGTGFHQELTGRENIYLNGAILGMTKAEVRSQLDEIVEFSGCARYIDTPVKRYSSGMMVRLGFAVAAHLEPEILIVDEVLAVGDAEFQKKCLGKMQDVARGGRTVLFVSHNMAVMSELCENVMLLESGCISAQGNAQGIVRKYLSSMQPSETQCSVDLENWSRDRQGNGPMRLRRVSVRDEFGKTCRSFAYGQRIEIDAEVVNGQGRVCIVCLAIRDANGNVILHPNNIDDKVELLLPSDPVRIRSAFTNTLNDGEYWLTVFLGDGTNICNDRVGNCLSFRVDSKASGRVLSQGMVRIPASWSVDPG